MINHVFTFSLSFKTATCFLIVSHTCRISHPFEPTVLESWSWYMKWNNPLAYCFRLFSNPASSLPHYAREIWKRRLISSVRPTSTLIYHENRAFNFENVLQAEEIGKRRLCVLTWTENILKTELFEKFDVTVIMWFPCLVRNLKWPVTVSFFLAYAA